MNNSSGIDVATRDAHLSHHCGFEGIVEFWYDPEIDRSSQYATCHQCGEEVQEAMR
jgi:hypothetical protein